MDDVRGDAAEIPGGSLVEAWWDGMAEGHHQPAATGPFQMH